MSGSGAQQANRRYALVVVALAFLFNFISRGLADSFLVFMLALEDAFGWSHTSLSGVYSVYLLTIGLCGPVTGALMDRLSPRVIYLAGLALMSASLYGAAMVSSLTGFYLTLGLMNGIASSALGMVPAAALIGRWFDRNLSTALGFAYAGFGSGILLMVPLSQSLIETFGWRSVYAIYAAAAACGVGLAALVPWQRLAAGRRPLETGVMPASEPRAAPAGEVVPPKRWTVRRAIGTPHFWLLVQVFFFTAAGMHSIVVQTVALLVASGYRAIEAAGAFGTAGMLSIAGVLGTGWLADRIGYRGAALLSFGGTLLGIVALYGAARTQAWPLLVVYVISFGLSQGARGPIVSALTNRIFQPGSVASIFGLIFMLMSFGAALGAWMSGLLYHWTGGYDAAFFFSCFCICLAAMPFASKHLNEFHIADVSRLRQERKSRRGKSWKNRL